MKLFLSHASESKPLVIRIVQGLPSHVQHWLDQTELSTGYRFGGHIETAIAEECDFLIAFLDDNALARDWVPREIALGLRREADLRRTFVLPVLLQDVRQRLAEVGPIGDRLYLQAWDHSDAGIAALTQRLADELFAHASRTLETLRGLGRRGMLDAFAGELTAYKQVAFMWRASLCNPIAVLVSNQAAFDHVADSVKAYNAVADQFVARLGLHRDRISAAWSQHVGLSEDLRDVVTRIERVYRGEMFALNQIHASVHRCLPPAALDTRTLRRHDREREALLGAAAVALDEVSERATRVIASLEREIR